MATIRDIKPIPIKTYDGICEVTVDNTNHVTALKPKTIVLINCFINWFLSMTLLYLFLWVYLSFKQAVNISR